MLLQTVFQNPGSNSSSANQKRHPRHCAARSTRRRAAAAPLFAVSLVMLITFVSLAVDVGYLCVTGSELQRTCDASALAGAHELKLGERQVYARATEYAGLNPVAAESVTDGLNVTIGYWEALAKEFTPSDGSQPGKPNAVYVQGARQDLAMFFAPVIGYDDLDVKREAVAVEGSGICAGVWGIVDANVGGNLVTDSYISADGPYGGDNIRRNGDLCSCEDLRFNGGIYINGDAMYGEGYTFTNNGAGDKVYGITGPHDCTPPTITPDFVAVSATNDNNLIPLTSNGTSPWHPGQPGTLQLVSDDVLLLPPGDYYFNNVDVMGTAQIVVTGPGPTNIYIAGDAHFAGGGIVNDTGDPAMLTIYSNGGDILINGGTGFYGAVLTPNSDVTLVGDADYYGTIIANTLGLQGAANIHVDETLIKDLFDLDSTRPILVR